MFCSLHRELVIADFMQVKGESLSVTWRRFTDLLSGRLHEYTLMQLFHIFYGGLWEDMQDYLEVLDNGSFLDRTPEAVWEYLESTRDDGQTIDQTPKSESSLPSQEGHHLDDADRVLDHGE